MTMSVVTSLRERVIDAVLHQDAVGAPAGLAGIAIFQAIAPLTAISLSALSKATRDAFLKLHK
jgi:hypothetical protein